VTAQEVRQGSIHAFGCPSRRRLVPSRRSPSGQGQERRHHPHVRPSRHGVEEPRVRGQRSEWFPADDLLGNIGVGRTRGQRRRRVTAPATLPANSLKFIDEVLFGWKLQRGLEHVSTDPIHRGFQPPKRPCCLPTTFAPVRPPETGVQTPLRRNRPQCRRFPGERVRDTACEACERPL
jgi:hypothetical protein